MARCTFGPIVTDMRGTLGGVCFKSGACAGVITRRRRMVATNSAAQVLTRHVLDMHMQGWRDMDANLRTAWNGAAQHLNWMRGNHTRGPLQGRQMFLFVLGVIDPHGTITGSTATVPLGVTYKQPVIDKVSFDADGICTVGVLNYTGAFINEYLTLDRHLEYGTRPAAGRRQACTVAVRQAASFDYASRFATWGIVLEPGELVRVTLRWAGYNVLPSGPVSTNTTVF